MRLSKKNRISLMIPFVMSIFIALLYLTRPLYDREWDVPEVTWWGDSLANVVFGAGHFVLDALDRRWFTPQNHLIFLLDLLMTLLITLGFWGGLIRLAWFLRDKIRSERAKIQLIVLVGLLNTLGCAGPGPTSPPLPEAPGEGWIRNPLEDTAIFLSTDNAMAKLVDIQNLTAYSNREGGLKASCQLHNLTPQPLPIQLRALFRRSDGTTLEESAWKSVTLPVEKFIPFEVVNESGSAARVLIEMRTKASAAPSAPASPQ